MCSGDVCPLSHGGTELGRGGEACDAVGHSQSERQVTLEFDDGARDFDQSSLHRNRVGRTRTGSAQAETPFATATHWPSQQLTGDAV